MRKAIDMFDTLPICGRLVKEAHKTLLSGVRGQDKTPGRYKRLPNYIGRHGRPISEARFVPIAPDQVEDGMARWEKYVNSEAPDPLVQLAVVHVEFESLHPFSDGNGRVGRMLIPLFLYQRGLLHQPMFYLSEHLERNRQDYYDRLLAVSRDDDWTGWCEFFLKAISDQATQNEKKVRQILNLYNSKKEFVANATKSPHCIAALDFLFDQPIFNTTNFIERSGIPAPTARRIVNILVKEGLLLPVQEARGSAAAIYAFAELLNIAEGHTVFNDSTNLADHFAQS